MVSKSSRLLVGHLMVCFLAACSGPASDLVDPYAEGGNGLGQRNNQAILTGGEAHAGGHEEKARHALEVLGSYRRAQEPQPYHPVMNPPVVRKMWIPDHLNSHGDLVPSHYYFLMVRGAYWGVQDAFEIEQQLDVNGQGNNGGAVPWVYSK